MLSFNSGSGCTLLDWYVGGGPLRMTAGRDIVASGTVGASNLIVHSNDTDVSVISAGRDIIYSRSEEHTSELQSLMRLSYAVFCLKKKNISKTTTVLTHTTHTNHNMKHDSHHL